MPATSWISVWAWCGARRPLLDEALITELYNKTGAFRGVNVAGVGAWAAGAVAFFLAGSIGGTLPALVVSIVVYTWLR